MKFELKMKFDILNFPAAGCSAILNTLKERDLVPLLFCIIFLPTTSSISAVR